MSTLKIPEIDTTIQTGHKQYLLFNNNKYNPRYTIKGWYFLLNLELTIKDGHLPNDIVTVKRPIYQVYQSIYIRNLLSSKIHP